MALLILYTTFERLIAEEVFGKAVEALPPDSQRRVASYKRWQDKYAFVLGRALLANGFNHMSADIKFDQIVYNNHGKPSVHNSPVSFNLSHSGKYVVSAFSDSAVGIDIEEVSHSIDLADFKQVLAPDEWESVVKGNNPVDTFFSLWALKESIAKADGRGLSAPITNLLRTDDKVILQSHAWFCRELNFGAGYKSYVASASPLPSEVSTHGIAPEELLRKLVDCQEILPHIQ